MIQYAASQLEWNNLKLVYTVENEAYNQEGINDNEAIADAKKKNIYINTIFCGSREEGIRKLWQDGAAQRNGNFFNIDLDRKVIYIATPYDDRISECKIK